MSVQQTLNITLSTILNEKVYTVGAGRTDTGVHAREMWAHFDFDKDLPPNFINRVNSFVGPDIAVREFLKVKDKAHARFDAESRSYEYCISRVKDPFLQDLTWFCPWQLDVQKMQAAADILFEFDDFSSFSKSNTQTMTNNCRIKKAEWEQSDEQLIFHIEADRFLRNMVRAIVGTLCVIGQGKKEVVEMREIIAAKDRRLAGESAPAHGLFLTRVKYPKEIFNGK